MSLIDELVPDLVGLRQDEIRERIEAYLENQARDMTFAMVALIFGYLDDEQRRVIAGRMVALQGALRAEFAALKAAQLAGASPHAADAVGVGRLF